MRNITKNRLSIVGITAGIAAAVLGIVSISLSVSNVEPEVSAAPTTTEIVTTTVKPTTTTTVVEATTTTEAYIPPTTTVYVPPTPPPAPEPIPEPVVVDVPSGSIEEMICNTFGDQCQKALSVAWCESRYNPGTVGAAGERGIMQIHPVHIQYLGNYGLTWDDMFDPAANLTYAYALYSSQGWGPWTCA